MKYSAIGDQVTNVNEFYAGIPGKDTPALLVMIPKRDAKVVTVRSVYREAGLSQDVQTFSQGDLIYHEVMNTDGSVRYHEWIVRNPAAIESYTADPRKIPEQVRPQLRRAQNPNFRLSREERFHPVDTFGKYERERIAAYFASNPEEIPETFRRDLGSNCPKDFGRFSAPAASQP